MRWGTDAADLIAWSREAQSRAWVAKLDTRGIGWYVLDMPASNARNVSLTDEQDALVERLVKSGRYASASEVVRDGLRLLQREEEARLLDKWLVEGLTPEEQACLPPGLLERARETIRAKVREGLEEARRGEFVDGEAFFARWKRRLDGAAVSGCEPSGVQRRA